jgi:hypothetical protein
VVSGLDAELIGRTRLEGMPLRQAAGQLGLSEAAARKRRQRSEPALTAAVLAGDVHAAMSPTITFASPRRMGAQSSGRSRISADANSDHLDPKGGMGDPSDSARTLRPPHPATNHTASPTTHGAAASTAHPSTYPPRPNPHPQVPTAARATVSEATGATSTPPSKGRAPLGVGRRAQDAPALFPQPTPASRQPSGRTRHKRWHVVPLAIAAALITLVILAIAARTAMATAVSGKPPTSPDQLGTVFNNLRNWLIGLLAALATLMLTLGGLRYLIAGGDPGEIQKAKAAFKASALGYALALLAPLFVNVLKRVVGG